MTDQKVARIHAESMPDVSTSQLAEKGGKRWMHMGTRMQRTTDTACLSVTQLALQSRLAKNGTIAKACQHAFESTSSC